MYVCAKAAMCTTLFISSRCKCFTCCSNKSCGTWFRSLLEALVMYRFVLSNTNRESILPVNWDELVFPGLANLLCQFHDSKLPHKVKADHNQRKEDRDNVRYVPGVGKELWTALLLHPDERDNNRHIKRFAQRLTVRGKQGYSRGWQLQRRARRQWQDSHRSPISLSIEEPLEKWWKTTQKANCDTSILWKGWIPPPLNSPTILIIPNRFTCNSLC